MEQAVRLDAGSPATTMSKSPWAALVVDDDAGVRQSLRLCLEAAGARVLGVATGGADLGEFRRTNVSEVLRAKNTLEGTLEALPDAVVLLDAAGQVQSMNIAGRLSVVSDSAATESPVGG